ncbi:hypothetical protein BASA83_013087 [Batrachochytrium salamandrivorans]|nr:hypothetical protein BASA83_013087 [Batrachochytrium salamandrivorans]
MASEDIKSGKCIGVYRGHEGTVYSLDVQWKRGSAASRALQSSTVPNRKVSPESPGSDVAVLVTGSHDQSIIIWEVVASLAGKTDASVKLKAHTGDVYALELLHDPDNIRRIDNLVSGGDYTIRTWNTDSFVATQILHGHTGYVACLKVRGKRAFSGSWDTTIRSWNIETGKGMHVFKGHKKYCQLH